MIKITILKPLLTPMIIIKINQIIITIDEGCKINQLDYIENLIKKYNMKKIKLIKYPSRKIPKDEREKSPEINKTIYKSIIGELLFIATKTSPDIAFAINQVARHSENQRKSRLKISLYDSTILKFNKRKINSLYRRYKHIRL